jgi:hypothetical protein
MSSARRSPIIERNVFVIGVRLIEHRLFPPLSARGRERDLSSPPIIQQIDVSLIVILKVRGSALPTRRRTLRKLVGLIRGLSACRIVFEVVFVYVVGLTECRGFLFGRSRRRLVKVLGFVLLF